MARLLIDFASFLPTFVRVVELLGISGASLILILKNRYLKTTKQHNDRAVKVQQVN